jgi:multidrug efflux pump subunit AcrB
MTVSRFSITDFAVKRWQFTLIVFAMLTALGLSSLNAIPKSEDPTFPLPLFVIVAVLPGASPSDLEQLVVDPIEERIQTLDELDHVQTEIRDQLAVIRVEFEAGVDVSRKEDEVRREIDSLRASLPAELVRLDVEDANASNVNVVELGLVSETASYAELDRLGRALEGRLEALPGVGEAEVAGVPPQEVLVSLDLPRMRAIGVGPGEVIDAIAEDGRNLPAGSIDSGARRFTVQTSGDYASIDEVRRTVVRAEAGRVVRVSDVATVSYGDGEAIHLTRIDGRRGIVVVANQREGQNILAVREAVAAVAAQLERELPEGIALVRTFDQADNVEHRLSGFVRDFGLAILLVLVTLLPLGVRASLVVMVSIPLSIAMGLTLLFGAGYGINQLSIVGFVIALGLLVDDSVVVIENIARFLRLGKTPREAAVAATRQITLSVLGCTATLILAFVPLLALPGTAGQFIRSLPLAVVLTVASSLLVSLTIVPFLASLFLKPESEHGNVVFRGMMWVIEGSYRPVLGVALRHPYLTLVSSALLFAGAIALVPSIGFSLFPKAGTPQFLVRVESAEGASLAETDRAVRFVEDTLARHDEIAWQVANVGEGNPQIFYNQPPPNQRPNVGEVYASLREFHPDSSPALLDAIRTELQEYAGARIRLIEFENGPPLEAPVAIRLLGDDVESLAEASAMVEAAMLESPGLRDVIDPAREHRTDLRVEVDRERAAALGVRVPDVDRAVRLALGGIAAGRYREEDDDVARDIRVVLARRGTSSIAGAPRPTTEVLDEVFVPTTSGGAVPLSAIASLVLEPSPTTIRHYDGERAVTVSAFTRTGFNTDRETTSLVARLDALQLPGGVRRVVAGEVESRQRSFGGLGTAILLAVFGILAVLVLEFRTFKGMIIVASVIPLGVIGGMAALYLTGNTLSFTAMIGFVALMGIEVKNSILLVDFTNQLREEGLGIDEAVQKAGEIRFVPILLTTLTAIGGLIPLALERSPLYSPLAWVILGGLVSSTLLARIVTPVLYKLLPPAIEKELDAAAGASAWAPVTEAHPAE